MQHRYVLRRCLGTRGVCWNLGKCLGKMGLDKSKGWCVQGQSEGTGVPAASKSDLAPPL